ncbi:MAG: peptidoglycan DD-metalloendopeptidase family protein [Bacteroidia bacterium]|nr:peptidoglycan DD-metalloendopeptidase family protein [Bacteroidia bacterium]
MICTNGKIEKHPFLKRFFLLALLICMGFAGQAAEIDKPEIAEQINSILADTVLSGFFAPIQGNVISHFGYRGRHKHAGTDIKCQHGDTIRAAFDGLVTKACPYSGYGNLVILKHPNSIETYYSHLSKCIVQNGDSVKAGQVVGLGGRTGRATTNHLHFEVRFNHVAKNPEKYFDFKNCEVKDAMKDKMGTYSLVVKTDAPTVLAFTPTVNPTTTETSSNLAEAPLLQADAALVEGSIVIRKGDTLYSLSRRYGTTVKQLQELNGLKNTNLSIGLKLKLK